MNAQNDDEDRTDWNPSKYRGMYKDLNANVKKESAALRDEWTRESPTLRFWEVDLLRGCAIVLMVLYHLVFDLNYFSVYNIDVSSGFWLAVARAYCLALPTPGWPLPHPEPLPSPAAGAGRWIFLSPPEAERLDTDLGSGHKRRHLSLHRQRLHYLRSAAPHRPLAAAGLSLSPAAQGELHFWTVIYIIWNIFAKHQRQLFLAALAGAYAVGILFGRLLSRLSLVGGDSAGNGPGQPALSQATGAGLRFPIFSELPLVRCARIPGTKLAGHLSGTPAGDHCFLVSQWCLAGLALECRGL